MPANRYRVLLGRRLRASRVSLGFDQGSFADELGIPHEAYERIEQGKSEPDLNTLIYAARVTGKSLDFLLTGRRPDPEAV